jgi:hypothetical protein
LRALQVEHLGEHPFLSSILDKHRARF